MKKLFRFTSVVLTVLMMMTSITSINVFATTDDPRLTWGTGAGVAIDIGVPGDAAKEIDAELAGTCYEKLVVSTTSQTSFNQTTNLVMKLTMPKFSAGKTLDKYIMRFCINKDLTTGFEWKFHKIPGTSTTGDGWTSTAIKNNAKANDSAAVERKVHEVSSNFKMTVVTVDVSSYAKECYEAGQEYFYIGLYNTMGVLAAYKNVSPDQSVAEAEGFNYTDIFPYAYYTEIDADPLSFDSVTNPKATDDGVVFTFSNPIDKATVSASDFTVTDFTGATNSVDDSDISIAGTKVTLHKKWESFTPYTVTLQSISDVYGQSFDSVCSTQFEVTVSGTTTKLNSNPLKLVCGNGTNYSLCAAHSGAAGVYSTPTAAINAKYHFVLFQFDLSSIPAGKSVGNVKFEYYNNYGNDLYVYHVPDYEWTADSGSDTAYHEKLKTACAYSASTTNPNKLIATVSTSKPYLISADATSVVADIVASSAANKKVTFAYAFPSGGTGSTIYLANHATYAPSLSLTLADASFDATEAIPAKGAAMDGTSSAVKATLATTLADGFKNGDYIQLVDAEADSAADVSIAVNGSEITVTPNADLKAHTRYHLVLKAGATDTLGNVLESDKIINSFITGTPLTFDPIILGTYSAGGSVTAVTNVVNASGTDLDALMIVVLYDANGRYLKAESVGGAGFAAANTTTELSTTMSIPSGVSGTSVKAFVWGGLDDIRPICAAETVAQQ